MSGTIRMVHRRGITRLLGVLVVLCAVNACGGGGGAPPAPIGENEIEPSPGVPEGTVAESAYVPWAEDEVHATLLPASREESGVPHHLWVDPAFPPGIRYEPYLDSSIYQDLAPVMESGSTLHVGADVAPPVDALTGTGSRGGVALSAGELRDGLGEAEVLAYLRAISRGGFNGVDQLRTWNSNPTVFVVGAGTDGRYLRLAREAGRIVNAALPFSKRIRLEHTDRTWTENYAARYRRHWDAIWVRFVPKSNRWWAGAAGDELGRTKVDAEGVTLEELERTGVGYSRLTAYVLIDPDAVAAFDDTQLTYLLVHELLHAMGFTAHVDATRFRSTLNETYVLGAEPRGLIHRIDREGLLGAYARLKGGRVSAQMDAGSLGPWNDTSAHLRGDLTIPSGNVAFGVAFRNDFPQPWAFGPTPATSLADNASLSGTVTWDGALVGRTPSGSVFGDTRLTVDFDKVHAPPDPRGWQHTDGTLAFTDIRYGDGSSWGDGELSYLLQVEGNRFRRLHPSIALYGTPEGPQYRSTGRDFGVVTGVFFGDGHEGMGGVIERHDMSGAFGGRRSTPPAK